VKAAVITYQAPRSHGGVAIAALILLATLIAPAAHAQQIKVTRCEGKDGSVTYSNRECPSGTTPARKVNTAPAVSVPDEAAAKDRAAVQAAFAHGPFGFAVRALDLTVCLFEFASAFWAELFALGIQTIGFAAKALCIFAKRFGLCAGFLS